MNRSGKYDFSVSALLPLEYQRQLEYITNDPTFRVSAYSIVSSLVRPGFFARNMARISSVGYVGLLVSLSVAGVGQRWQERRAAALSTDSLTVNYA